MFLLYSSYIALSVVGSETFFINHKQQMFYDFNFVLCVYMILLILYGIRNFNTKSNKYLKQLCTFMLTPKRINLGRVIK